MITKLLNFNLFDKGEGNDYSETLAFRFFSVTRFFAPVNIELLSG